MMLWVMLWVMNNSLAIKLVPQDQNHFLEDSSVGSQWMAKVKQFISLCV